MSVQHIWNFFQLLGLFNCCRFANLSLNFVTETCKQRPETTRRRLWCEKLGTSNDVKGFAIGLFLERIVVNLCSKNVKNTGLISAKPIDFQRNLPQNRPFFTDCFLVKIALKFPAKFPRNWPIFREFVPKNPAKFDFFLRDLSVQYNISTYNTVSELKNNFPRLKALSTVTWTQYCKNKCRPRHNIIRILS